MLQESELRDFEDKDKSEKFLKNLEDSLVKFQKVANSPMPTSPIRY